jgi:hypothetical protein
VLAALKSHGHDIPLNQARAFQRIAPGGSGGRSLRFAR